MNRDRQAHMPVCMRAENSKASTSLRAQTSVFQVTACNNGCSSIEVTSTNQNVPWQRLALGPLSLAKAKARNVSTKHNTISPARSATTSGPAGSSPFFNCSSQTYAHPHYLKSRSQLLPAKAPSHPADNRNQKSEIRVIVCDIHLRSSVHTSLALSGS